jgi:drug/metabolite transporter (DMT)-like permease
MAASSAGWRNATTVFDSPMNLDQGRTFLWVARLGSVGSALLGMTGIAAYFAFVHSGLLEVGAAHRQVLLSLVPLITFFLALEQGL